MKAVFCPAYGPPEVLEIRDMPRPIPKKNEILVKVIASAVNSGDTRIRGLRVKGFMKLVMRIMLGFTRPRKPVLGTVFSGVVEQTGEEVNGFKAGDEVYGTTGFNQGCYAEYVCIPDGKVITRKPANATFEESAALPFGGQTALYFLGKGNISGIEHPRVMVYGATGSVGTAALQVARYYNATVTAVSSSRGEKLARQLGADRVILYDQEDFTRDQEKYDIIFDAVGKTSKKACTSLLKPGGKFLTVESMDVADERTEYLDFLRERFEEGKYHAVIDKVFPMDQVVEAHRYVDTGKKKGNIVLNMTVE